MDKKKVLAVSIILLVFVMAVGAYYGVVPTIQKSGTSAQDTTVENKAYLQGIPDSITMTNTTNKAYTMILTGVKGSTTQVNIEVMQTPTNVTAYFTTTSASDWKITNNGTRAEYVGYPMYAGDLTNDLILHIKATGEPVEGTINYIASSNDILVVENGLETTVSL